MPSVFIKTFGCQMNERDSEAVAAQLVAKGYALAESEAELGLPISPAQLAELRASQDAVELDAIARNSTLKEDAARKVQRAMAKRIADEGQAAQYDESADDSAGYGDQHPGDEGVKH